MKKSHLILFLSFMSFQFLSAQNLNTSDIIKQPFKHLKQDITIGAGFNAVYDTGLRGTRSTEGSSWNFSNPFYVSGEYYFNSNYSIVGILSLNKYKEGKFIDGYFISENSSANFIAFDVAAKYSFRDLLNWISFEPYALTGLGINSIGEYMIDDTFGEIPPVVPAETRVNYVIGAGMNYWLSDFWAINFNVSYKVGLGKDIGDQLQPSIGAVYKITQ